MRAMSCCNHEPGDMRNIIIPASFGLFPVVCWAVTAVSLTKMDRKWQDLQKFCKRHGHRAGVAFLDHPPAGARSTSWLAHFSYFSFLRGTGRKIMDYEISTFNFQLQPQASKPQTSNRFPNLGVTAKQFPSFDNDLQCFSLLSGCSRRIISPEGGCFLI